MFLKYTSKVENSKNCNFTHHDNDLHNEIKISNPAELLKQVEGKKGENTVFRCPDVIVDILELCIILMVICPQLPLLG